MANQGAPNNGRQVRRRRQELRIIPTEEARHVSFSKRRNGLCTKASELATLCGVEVAVLVNSPAGRPYTFGSPAVDPIFNRFLSNNPNQPNQSAVPFDSECQQQLAMINNLNQQCVDLSTQLDAAKFRRALLNDRLKRAANTVPECNWSKRINELQVKELSQLLNTLCKTKERLVAREKEINKAECSSSSQAEDGLVNYSGQQHGLVIGNDSIFFEGSHPTDSHSVQADETNISTSEQMVLSSIPPSLSINSGTGVDLRFNPGLVFNFKGANNAMMPTLYGLSFGPFTSNQGNHNLSAGNTSNINHLFFDPNEFGQRQSYGMSNPQIPYNFNSDPFQFSTPLGDANYGSNQTDSDSLARLVWPSSSIPQGQYFWGTSSFRQNMLPGYGSGALDQAGPSNSGMNNLIGGPNETNPVDSEETNPGASSSEQGPQ